MNKNLLIALVLTLLLVGGVALTLWVKQDQKPSATLTQTGTTLNTPADGNYLVIPKSTINWAGRKTLIANWTDKGTLEVSSGTVTVESGAPAGIDFTFDMNSISTQTTGSGKGMDNLSKHLKSPDFFDAEKHPTARFELTRAQKSETSPTEFTITGNLTIKDITKEVSFPAEIYQDGDLVKADAQFSIDRTTWDIRYGSGKLFDNLANNVIDDMIDINFSLSATKQ